MLSFFQALRGKYIALNSYKTRLSPKYVDLANFITDHVLTRYRRKSISKNLINEIYKTRKDWHTQTPPMFSFPFPCFIRSVSKSCFERSSFEGIFQWTRNNRLSFVRDPAKEITPREYGAQNKHESQRNKGKTGDLETYEKFKRCRIE